MKFTDLGVAFFTYCLVVIGYLAIRSEERSTKISERAYIYGGVGTCFFDHQNGQRMIRVCFTMANYGSTAGYLRHIEVGTARLSDLPSEPYYIHCFGIWDLYFPGMTMRDVQTTRATVIVPDDGNHVVFQRVYYHDVFGVKHFSGSIYKMFVVTDAEGNVGIGNEPIAGGSTYWAWDKNDE